MTIGRLGLVRVKLGVRVDAGEIILALVQPESVGLDISGGQITMSDEAADQQLQLLERTLHLARSAELGGGRRVRFIVLPEYSLPSRRLAAVEEIVAGGLGPDQILLAGFDAMGYDRYRALAGGAAGVGSAPRPLDAPPARLWVNPGILWARDRDGNLERHIQAKLCPANGETAVGGMVPGDRLLLFQAGDLHFAFIICRDLIASVRQKGAPAPFTTWLPHHLKRDLDLLFVLQMNEKPNEFLAPTHTLLSSRKVGAVVAVNHAPDGATSICLGGPYKYPPDLPPSSYAFEYVAALYRARLRSREGVVCLAAYRGQAQHLGERSILPVEVLAEHPIRQGIPAPAGERVGCFQWALRAHGRSLHPALFPAPARDHQVTSQVAARYDEIHGALAAISDELVLRELVDLLLCVVPPARAEHPGPEPASWTEEQGRLLGALLRTLARLGVAGPVTIDADRSPLAIRLPWAAVDLLVVAGSYQMAYHLCLESTVSWLEQRRPAWARHRSLLVVLHHAGVGSIRAEPLQVLGMADRSAARHRSALQAVDSGPIPPGMAQPAPHRIDELREPMVRCLSGSVLYDAEGAPDLKQMVERIKGVLA